MLLHPLVSLPVPLAELRAEKQTADRLKHMAAPAQSQSAWQAAMNRLYLGILRNIGIEAARLARATVLGGPAGAGLEAALLRATPITRMLRGPGAPRSAHPLREYGRLGKAIRAMVDTAARTVTVGVPAGQQTRAKARALGGDTMELSQLALNLEQGYRLHITPKARTYFKIMALRTAEESALRVQAGDVTVGGKRTGLAALRASESEAWWALYGKGEGYWLIPARPFLRPAVELAADRFQQTQIDAFGQKLANFWVRGAQPSDGVEGAGDVGVEAGIF